MTCRTALVGLLFAMLAAVWASRSVAQKDGTPVTPPATGYGLAAPIPVRMDGRPLAPWGSPGVFVGDFDGDGRRDLLLGDGFEGRLVIHRNVGTKTDPRLSGRRWFDDQVPTGRIPKG